MQKMLQEEKYVAKLAKLSDMEVIYYNQQVFCSNHLIIVYFEANNIL